MTIKDIHYNNGKVLIGSAYDLNPLKPKYVEKDHDMLEIQSYLIYDPRVLNRRYWTEKGLLILGLFIVLVIFLKS
jgi:hypothetical protein